MRYVARKLGFYLVAAWVALTINFLLPQLIPGNPVEALIGRMSQSGTPPPGEAKVLTALLGLGGGNIVVKYGRYLDGLVHLRLGLSIADFPTPVSTEISQSIYWTLILVGTATVISFVLGIGAGRAGRLEARLPARRDHPGHHVPHRDAVLLARADPAVPVLLQRVARLPAGPGYDTNSELSPGWNLPFLASAVQHAILPALTIVLSSVGGWLLGMRNMMVSTLSEDYVVAAEAKGLRPAADHDRLRGPQRGAAQRLRVRDLARASWSAGRS